MSTKYPEAVTALQELVIRHGLPGVDYALFGVKCPYCGKTDRVHRLESPDKLQQIMDSKDTQAYAKRWHVVSRPEHSIGVCKFCYNLLSLDANTNAEPLAE